MFHEIKKSITDVCDHITEWRKRTFVTSYKYIVVGGGTSGCITAYWLARLMQEKHIPGRVLLVDGGKEYLHTEGPHPRMWNWFDNWAKFSVIHDTTSVAPDFLPPTGSSHQGIGGAGAHDTRITFYPTASQLARMSNAMGWDNSGVRLMSHYQQALDMMPLQSASDSDSILNLFSFSYDFYDAVLQTLHGTNVLTRVQEYKGRIVPRSAGYVSIAMYMDETRWTSAYLMDPTIRPNNLDVRTNFIVDKIAFDGATTHKKQRAIGVMSASGETINVTSEIIIAAGSLGTPAILQRSGIGPRATLERLGIPVVVSNDEVGHGVDHTEIAVTYKFLPQWNEANGLPPRGGPMAWPLVMFLDGDGDTTPPTVMAHFGISPPPYGGNEVTGTPNCMHPDVKSGFRARITTTDATIPISIVHDDPVEDMKVLVGGVRKMIDVFEVLRRGGIVGDRVSPTDDEMRTTHTLDHWIRQHAGTAYHWMSTCKASAIDESAVADGDFRVRGVDGLRVGSGAVLPEIPEANPHLTISAFSIALAHTIVEQQQHEHHDCGQQHHGQQVKSNEWSDPSDVIFDFTAYNHRNITSVDRYPKGGNLTIKRDGCILDPDVKQVARLHRLSHYKD